MAPKNKKIVTNAPWRQTGSKRIVPLVSNASLRIQRGQNSQYALSIMKHPDPIGTGLARDTLMEAAGEDCLVPGYVRPKLVAGVQVWPLNLPDVKKYVQPVWKEMQTLFRVATAASSAAGAASAAAAAAAQV
eukprot:jgi/Mesen1/4115/ME000216S03365